MHAKSDLVFYLLVAILMSPKYSLAAATDWKVNPEGQVRLIAAENGVPKSGPIFLGFHFKTAPGWYVYWKQAGDAGYPPKVDWHGSQGLQDPEFLWPAPTKF